MNLTVLGAYYGRWLTDPERGWVGVLAPGAPAVLTSHGQQVQPKLKPGARLKVMAVSASGNPIYYRVEDEDSHKFYDAAGPDIKLDLARVELNDGIST